MTAGEVLDQAAATYRSQGRMMIRLTALPVLFCFLAVVFVAEYLLPSFFLTSDPNSLTTQYQEAAVTLLVALGVALPLFLVSLGYTSALVTRITSDDLTGNVPDPTEVQIAAAKATINLLKTSLWTLLLPVGLVVATLPVLGLSAWLSQRGSPVWEVVSGAVSVLGFCVSGILLPVFLMRYALAPTITVLEGLAPRAANRRAGLLLQKAPPHPHGYDHLTQIGTAILFLAVVAGLGISTGLAFIDLPGHLGNLEVSGFPLEATLAKITGLTAWYAAFLIVIPLWTCATTILYFDRRIRLEGFDISLMERNVRRTRRETRFVV